AVACGGSHTLAITSYGVLTWGSNSNGQLGLGRRHPGPFTCKPHLVSGLRSHKVTQVVAGLTHSLCLTEQCQVFSWGGNQWGQLGLGHRSQMRSPQLVAGLWGQPVVQLCGGEDHSLALTATHHVFSWGRNQHGQLGLGVEEPAELTGPPPHFPLAAPEGCGSGGSRGTRVPSSGPDAGSGRIGPGCGSTPLPGLMCDVTDVAPQATTTGHMSGASCWELRLAQLDQDKLGQLLDMGILMDHAALALMQTGCTGVEVGAAKRRRRQGW
ncbi:regulator of chromosome condensation 1/beta-lactamase-inhibitor protein II, partial [Haematococcus lacustris]